MTSQEVRIFQDKIWSYYQTHQRVMPWRTQPSPYHVLVSELMLQQTQVSRVVPKFIDFISRFPDIESLANAPLAEVITAWNGLGYNRRAKFLHQSAQEIVKLGEMPQSLEALIKLPGIGHNTAAAILNYAFEIPTAYVETNIRTVFFHELRDEGDLVDDRHILVLVEQTMDHEQPREWFYALMDYVTMLKATEGGKLDRSSHYKKQPPLRGSVREMRGRIIKVLSRAGELDERSLREAVDADIRYAAALKGLADDGLVERGKNEHIRLTGAVEPS